MDIDAAAPAVSRAVLASLPPVSDVTVTVASGHCSRRVQACAMTSASRPDLTAVSGTSRSVGTATT
jgi:hypothetical protein